MDSSSSSRVEIPLKALILAAVAAEVPSISPLVDPEERLMPRNCLMHSLVVDDEGLGDRGEVRIYKCM